MGSRRWSSWLLLAPLQLLASSCTLLYGPDDGPSARFFVDDFGCDQTEVAPQSVVWAPGASGYQVTTLHWTITYGSVDIVDFEEAIGSSLGVGEHAGLHVLGGTPEAPRFNLTPYRGTRVLRYRHVSATSSLSQVFATESGYHDLEAALRIEPDSPEEDVVLTASFATDEMTIIREEPYRCGDTVECAPPQWSYRASRFRVDSDQAGEATFQLFFAAPGTYWFDRVVLFRGDQQVVPESSFEEETAISSWTHSVEDEGEASVDIVPIPDALRRDGVYTIRLRAIDEFDYEGPPHTVELLHAACSLP